MAEGASMGCPCISRRFWMVPSLAITACSTTDPWMRACRASGGYSGVTLWINRPSDTPCDTRTRWGVAALGTATGVELMMPPTTPPISPPGPPPRPPPPPPPPPPPRSRRRRRRGRRRRRHQEGHELLLGQRLGVNQGDQDQDPQQKHLH